MFEQVKQEIDNKIKTNGNNEITATRLNGVLQDMMDATAEELSGYVQKTDPPSPAAGDIVVFNEFGGLGTSEKTVNDFATASQGAKADTALQPTGVKTINNQSIVGSGNITIEGGGTDDYADLDNKPQINSVALSGNKSASDLGLATAAQGAKADTAVQPSALNDYVQKSQTTGLLKNDGTVDTQTADRAESALQPLSGAQENNFASFDSDGGIKDSGCNEGTFIKGVQQNGVDLQKNANGKVNVTVQDGEDGLSAFEIAQQQGYTGTVDQWLASLKANIGEFKFVNTVAAVQTQFENDGVGSVYASSIDGVTADASTLSVILLMTTSGLSPEKTYMIATQDDGSSSFEFVYAGDLQSAMPSDVLTEDDIDNDFAGGNGKVAGAEEAKVLYNGFHRYLTEDVTGILMVGYVTSLGTINTTNTSYNRTDYIPVTEDDEITAVGAMGNGNGYILAGFDENKDFVSDSSINTTGNNASARPLTTVTKIVPAGISYIIVSQALSYNGNVAAISVTRTYYNVSNFVDDNFPNKEALDKLTETDSKPYYDSSQVIRDNDFQLEVVSKNIANPANIEQDKLIGSSGGIVHNENALGWALIHIPVEAGKSYTFTGFKLNKSSGRYAFYNDTTLVTHDSCADPNGTERSVTVQVPSSGVNTLYINIKSPDSPANPYQYLQINEGATLQPYDEYELGISAINGKKIVGADSNVTSEGITQLEADVEQLQDDVTSLQAGGYGIIVDLPVDDGTGVDVGDAYIDSTTGIIKVKLS